MTGDIKTTKTVLTNEHHTPPEIGSSLAVQPHGSILDHEGAPPCNTAPHNCILDNADTRVLRMGVDSLYLSYPGTLSKQWDYMLDSLKTAARSPDPLEQATAQVETCDHIFQVMDRGKGKYAYVMKDNHYNISLSSSASTSLPMAYVQLSSELLTFSNLDDVEDPLRYIMNTLGLVREEPNISRVDLCVDFTSPVSFEDIPLLAWVTRAHEKNRYSQHNKFTGWTIGSGGVMSARLYDKTQEIKKSGKDYLHHLWKEEGWNGTDPVWRLEFQYRRDVLAELGVKKFSDLLTNVGNLWTYATNDWLRLTLPSLTDQTQTRWPTHPLWSSLSSLDWSHTEPRVLRRVRKQSVPSDESLFINGLGAITSFMAREGIEDLGEGFGEFLAHAEFFHDHERSGTEKGLREYVKGKVKQKNCRFGTTLNHSPNADEQKEKSDQYRKVRDGD